MLKINSNHSTRSPRSRVAGSPLLETAMDVALKALTLLVVIGGVVFALSSAIFGGMG